MKKNVWMRCLVAGMAAAVVLSGCGSSAGEGAGKYMAADNATAGAAPQEYYGESYYYDDADYGFVEESAAMSDVRSATGSTTSDTPDVQQTNRKLIRTVNMSVETQDFTGLVNLLKERTQAFGGYIESSYEYNGSNYSRSTNLKNASLTLRIPASNLDDFLSQVSDASNVVSRSENTTDVTLAYVDMESHRNVLRTEEERVLAMMENTMEMEELIYLENTLADIRYQLESMESQLRTYDNQVDYSTVYIDISEVEVLTPTTPEAEPTFWEKMGDGISNSLTDIGEGFLDFCIWFVSALPYLILHGALIFIGFLIVRGIYRAAVRKKNAKIAARYAMQNSYMEAGMGNGAPVVNNNGGNPVVKAPAAAETKSAEDSEAKKEETKAENSSEKKEETEKK